jgi:hypothetical protein
MEQLKQQIEQVLREEMAKGTRKANLEIELIHFIKAVLKD